MSRFKVFFFSLFHKTYKDVVHIAVEVEHAEIVHVVVEVEHAAIVHVVHKEEHNVVDHAAADNDEMDEVSHSTCCYTGQ